METYIYGLYSLATHEGDLVVGEDRLIQVGIEGQPTATDSDQPEDKEGDLQQMITMNLFIQHLQEDEGQFPTQIMMTHF